MKIANLIGQAAVFSGVTLFAAGALAAANTLLTYNCTSDDPKAVHSEIATKHFNSFWVKLGYAKITVSSVNWVGKDAKGTVCGHVPTTDPAEVPQNSPNTAKDENLKSLDEYQATPTNPLISTSCFDPNRNLNFYVPYFPEETFTVIDKFSLKLTWTDTEGIHNGADGDDFTCNLLRR